MECYIIWPFILRTRSIFLSSSSQLFRFVTPCGRYAIFQRCFYLLHHSLQYSWLLNVAAQFLAKQSICIEYPQTLENYYLTVSNPIQPKKSNDTSSGVGLNNLSNRCKLLLGEGIIVTKANNLFTVKVPLAYE